MGTVGRYSCSAEIGDRPRASRASCSLPKSAKAQRISSCGFALLAGAVTHLLQAVIDEIQLQIVVIDAGRIQAEHAHFPKLETDAAAGGEIADILGDQIAHGGDGAHRIVGGGLDQQRDAVRRVRLVQHLLVVGGIAPRSALDGRFDLVLGHVHGTRVLHGAPQAGIAGRVRHRRPSPPW